MAAQNKRDIGKLLSLPGLGKGRELAPADPPVSTLITVELDQIETCALNPRQQENPVFFTRLREAIRINGLDTPIPITRKPGQEKYMVSAGGNTRLKALRSLYKETGDAKFSKVSCIFKPYVSDIEILAAHLRENDLRDNLVFIDHAMAIQNLRAMLEEQRGTPISRLEMEKILREMGHPISRRDLGRMDYAATVLYPVVPLALRNGAGQRLVDRIGRIDAAYRKSYGDALEEMPEGEARPEFGPLFEHVLSLRDSEILDLDGVRTDLDHRIAEVLGLPANRVRLLADAELAMPGGGETNRRTDTAGRPSAEDARGSASGMDSQAAATAVPEKPCDAGEKVSPATQAPESADAAGTGNVPDSDPLKTATGQNPPVEEEGSARIEGGAQESSRPPADVAQEPEVGNLPPPAVFKASPPAAPLAIPSVFQEAPPGDETHGIASLWPAAKPAAAARPASSSFPEVFPVPAPSDSQEDSILLRESVFARTRQLASAGGIQDLVVLDLESPGGFVLLELPNDDGERQAALWHLLAGLAGQDSPSNRYLREFLGLDGAEPPSDGVLRDFFHLLESVVALARTRAHPFPASGRS